jgi:hypothetical protein
MILHQMPNRRLQRNMHIFYRGSQIRRFPFFDQLHNVANIPEPLFKIGVYGAGRFWPWGPLGMVVDYLFVAGCK